jgi:hypothetical protein
LTLRVSSLSNIINISWTFPISLQSKNSKVLQCLWLGLKLRRFKVRLIRFSLLTCGTDKAISDWWAHKYVSKWIVPCILRSQSNILPEDWDSIPATTNIGEGQHHWTNQQSGIKLPLVEAILTCVTHPSSSKLLC